MYNQDQITRNLDSAGYLLRSSYERSADGKAWLYYPCDDHVIRVIKTGNWWTATLTTMRDRNTALNVCCSPERGAAIRSMLWKMQSSGGVTQARERFAAAKSGAI